MKSTRKNLSRLLAIFLLLALVLGMAPQGVFAAENEPSDASQALAEATDAPTEPIEPTQFPSTSIERTEPEEDPVEAAAQVMLRAVSSGLGKGTFYQYDSPTVRATNDYHNNVVGTTNGSVPNHCCVFCRNALE